MDIIESLRRKLEERKVEGWVISESKGDQYKSYTSPRTGISPLNTLVIPEHTIGVRVITQNSAEHVGDVTNTLVDPSESGMDTFLDSLVANAKSQKNPIYTIVPEVKAKYAAPKLEDPQTQSVGDIERGSARLNRAFRDATERNNAKLAQIRFMGSRGLNRVLTSWGVDVSEGRTLFSYELRFVVGNGLRKGEYIAYSQDRRKFEDFDPDKICAKGALKAKEHRFATRDINYTGPVIITEDALVDLLAASGVFGSTPLKDHTSAGQRYFGRSILDVGKSICRKQIGTEQGGQFQNEDQIVGDRLTVTIDSTLDWGTASSSFSELDGTPTRRATLIDKGIVTALWGSWRVYDMAKRKGIETGPFVGSYGNVLVEPGNRSMKQLRQYGGPILVVKSFSSFMPDPNGRVKLECRQGYLVDGSKRTDVTNFIFGSFYWDMFGNARFSKEMMHTGNYHGPKAMRFEGPFEVRKN